MPFPVAHQDYLLTIAEVAAAFVGFSMVVGVLAQGASESQARRMFVRDVAEIGFYALGGALAPYALWSLGIPTGLVWRVSSLGLLSVWVVGFFLAMRRFSRVGTFRNNPLVGRVARFVNPALVFLGNGLLAWNVISPGPPASGRYIMALLTLLLLSAFMFVRGAFERED